MCGRHSRARHTCVSMNIIFYLYAVSMRLSLVDSRETETVCIGLCAHFIIFIVSGCIYVVSIGNCARTVPTWNKRLNVVEALRRMCARLPDYVVLLPKHDVHFNKTTICERRVVGRYPSDSQYFRLWFISVESFFDFIVFRLASPSCKPKWKLRF